MNDDALQRQQALNPEQSFIVQAPAGSGKTELLTRRYLVLLAQVNQPEEVIAITFTRKAAAEMRARVIAALESATQSTVVESTNDKLAKKVLNHQAQRQWNLLENPNRFRIQTIDALCAKITRQMPVLSGLGTQPSVAENSGLLYRLATQTILSELENTTYSDTLSTLLLHLDNDRQKVEQLLCNMLKNRDQWLHQVIDSKINIRGLRIYLEQGLKKVRDDLLTTLKKSLPQETIQEIYELLSYARPEHAQNLEPDKDYFWFQLPEFLLTQEKDWRKKVTKREGFPAKSAAQNQEEKNHTVKMKQRMEALLAELKKNDELLDLLKELSLAPPANYTDSQWTILTALLKLLPRLVAQLQLIFQQYKQVDYIEVMHSALQALGDSEAATDLALHLDHQIQHILVDEFQDTSVAQLNLIKQLMVGWQPGDGRTIFLVGDPMQSIYRFRKAEVGLFAQVRHYGIHGTLLQPLTLHLNFRSVPNIVQWINAKFSTLLPAEENKTIGAIPFTASSAHKKTTDDKSGVYCHGLLDASDEEEAETVVKLLRDTLRSDPKSHIGILVRARSHLNKIIPALNNAKLPYQAIEIDSLSTQPFIHDLMALTRALLHPADSIAWLSVLRAPWCGLVLNDLHSLVDATIKHNSVLLDQLVNFKNIQLTEAGQQRLASVVPVLQNGLKHRTKKPLSTWIADIWLQLGGPACLNDISELHDTRTFFKLIEKVQQGNDIVDFSELSKQIHHLYSTAHTNLNSPIEIMTIHKAKGLEFDTVILPCLNRGTRPDEPELLLLMERLSAVDSSHLLLAPIKASSEDKDAIYAYLNHEKKKQAAHELTRLLYVASTRAKQTLHLVATINTTNHETPAKNNSLLSQLWPAIKDEMVPSHLSAKIKANNSEPLALKKKLLKRLTLNWKNPMFEDNIHLPEAAQTDKPETFRPGKHDHAAFTGYHETSHQARALGTVVHALLYQMSQMEHPVLKNPACIPPLLVQQGVHLNQLEEATSVVQRAIQQTLNDDRGRWILNSQHPDAHSEYSLTCIVEKKIQTVTFDRTFIDKMGTRWIIDYKTSIDTSLATIACYREQLIKYAKVMKMLDPLPKICLGLYFPLLPSWLEWPFDE